MEKDEWVRDRDGKILLPNSKSEIPFLAELIALVVIVVLIGFLIYGC